MANWQYSDFEDCGFVYPRTKKAKHIYQYVYEPDNLLRCIAKSQRRKHHNRAVIRFNEHFAENVDTLYWLLREERFVPGPLRKRIIYEPKERVLQIPPYFPDRIVDHCVVSVVEPLLMATFLRQTYSCIKGRGIHGCMQDVVKALRKDPDGTRFALIMDVHKYYDNIDHAVLKRVYRKKIADRQMLHLLDSIVDCNHAAVGLPIGKYTSQLFGNLYLTPFGHWLFEVMHCKHVFIYMDNILILSDNKAFLHDVFTKSALYLASAFHLEINANWQVFPVDKRDIDHVGFRMNHHDVRLRKGILNRFYAKLNRTQQDLLLKCESDVKHAYSSEYGWLTHCNEQHKDFIINQIVKDNERYH